MGTKNEKKSNNFNKYVQEAQSRLMGTQTILGNTDPDDLPSGEKQENIGSSEEPLVETAEKITVGSNDNGKMKSPARKSGRSKKSKKDVSKKMEDNQAAVMFYLPEDVKLDLSIYAKKHKKAVAEILRELVVEKIYS